MTHKQNITNDIDCYDEDDELVEWYHNYKQRKTKNAEIK